MFWLLMVKLLENSGICVKYAFYMPDMVGPPLAQIYMELTFRIK